jgi:hypothetical protein
MSQNSPASCDSDCVAKK